MLQGLSPRVRGNLIRYTRGATAGHRGRSIPARAGEPGTVGCGALPASVDPRACGGTISGAIPDRAGPGLSPRVRGNLVEIQPFAQIEGSIPARAGEPGRAWRPVCVGNRSIPARAGEPGTGRPQMMAHFQHRSIPARAGEPRSRSRRTSPRGVYPRACGGTL